MRVRILFGVIAGVLLLAGAVRGSDAATVTAGIGLNLRACPSLDCQVYTVMPYGVWAEPTGGISGDWYEVTWAGVTGWAHGAWLAYDGGPAAPAPVAEPQWARGSEPAPAASWGGGVSFITGGSVPGDVDDAVYAAAAAYGVSGDWLWSVVLCESGGDPNAIGPNGEIGIFQFEESTFYAYGGSNIWSYWDQANVAASMFAQGLSWHWVCA